MIFQGDLPDGFIFTSDRVFKHQGAYTTTPRRPSTCDKCVSRSGAFHAHGRYKRSLRTIKDHTLTWIKVWRHRWLCLCCGRTMSNGPDDVIAHVPNCMLIIAALLWCYFQSGNGIYKGTGSKLDQAAAPRTLARYLARAKAIATNTQQAIREVLIAINEPRPWDQGFAHGLSPPQGLLKRHHNAHKTELLWRALAMLIRSTGSLCVNPCLIMARAKIRTELLNSRFLI